MGRMEELAQGGSVLGHGVMAPLGVVKRIVVGHALGVKGKDGDRRYVLVEPVGNAPAVQVRVFIQLNGNVSR